MNKLLNLYGVKIHSECAFLSFLENSRNEVEAFSSSYLERKIGNLVFSIPADEASKGLNQVVPFLVSSDSWNGLVSRPATEDSQDSISIRPKIGGDYTRDSLRFLPIQVDVAFNTTVGNEVTFKLWNKESPNHGFLKRQSMAEFKKFGLFRPLEKRAFL